MKKLRNGDPVIVISWKHKWKVSVIEKIDWERVYVTWVNEAKKAMKGKWFIKKLLPIHISNIMYYLESEKKWSKIKIDIKKDWKRVRKTKLDNKVVN